VGGNDEANGGTDLLPIGLGGGVGAVVLAGMIFARYRRNARHERILGEKWTIEEENRLKLAFQRTHDFEELCKVVPGRSRESVAARTKHLLEPRHTMMFHSILNKPMEGYTFIAERTKKFVPSALVSHRYIPSAFSSKRTTRPSNQQESVVSFHNANDTMVYKGPANVPSLPGYGQRVSENPLYFTDY